MIDANKRTIELKILGVVCMFVLVGILVAGLWPFHHPSNEVTWLTGENGVRFGRHGTALSSRPIMSAGPGDGASGALEIWVRPNRTNSEHTLLGFSTPEHPLQFSMRKYRSGIVLRSMGSNQPSGSRAAEIYIADVFHQGQLLLLSVTSGVEGTATYVNGALLNASPNFHFSSNEFAGQLVFGTSPIENDGWSGQLRGLAIYKHGLNAAQVASHWKTWSTKGRPDLSRNERVLALYLFDEHQGRVVHDRSGSGIDLYIPERYLIVRQKFLEPPCEEFRRIWSWKNVGINIGGFVPLGFFFCAYLTMARQMSRPALVTIIMGAVVSFTIEVLQAFLPTRDSGMTDLITNTLGTCLGVLLYRWKATLLSETVDRITFAVLR
jgi:VanZ family protein